MFLSMQYVIIMIMLMTVSLKYRMSEFSRVLLSVIFVDLKGVVDRKCIWRIYEPRSIKMEPMMKNASNVHMEVNALS